jgi:hypothetical protein
MPLSVPMFAGMTLSDPEKRKLLRRRELVDRGGQGIIHIFKKT